MFAGYTVAELKGFTTGYFFRILKIVGAHSKDRDTDLLKFRMMLFESVQLTAAIGSPVTTIEKHNTIF